MQNNKRMFSTAICNKDGDLFSEPDAKALGRLGDETAAISEEHVIPIPGWAYVSMLPGRHAVGKRKKKKKWKRVVLKVIEKEQVFPVAAILPPGYTRTLTPVYVNAPEGAPRLPFFGYTAMAFKGGDVYVAAVHTHHDIRWDPSMYNGIDLPKRIKIKKKAYKDNRLIEHLGRCALNYRCFTAQNIFYDRWEGGIPTSPACNAGCIGCISQSHMDGTSSPQQRIEFLPTVDEIVEIAAPHLQNEGAIASFGQGCEGEPLTRGLILCDAVERIRSKTDKGTININTNGSRPDMVERMFDAGLNSIRISLNSCVQERYERHFCPQNYKFEDVVKSIDVSIEKGGFVSLNYLHMPGLNDRESELEALFKFLDKHPVNMIQLRNLNVDPDHYLEIMEIPPGRAVGTKQFIERLKKQFPDVKIGNFSIPAPGYGLKGTEKENEGAE